MPVLQVIEMQMLPMNSVFSKQRENPKWNFFHNITIFRDESDPETHFSLKEKFLKTPLVPYI